ncbi:MAG: hypothetical protein E7L17_10770 [Clostridium sp.]|uniref:hypothetical protein n=1 Tax=Clostridium sp. TaxID=1506 RepID=UPI00290DD6D2|nr:hypothetical protein [Clostridium sp.]MDU7338582.1 hypothetical protein [Clostridium sp.]
MQDNIKRAIENLTARRNQVRDEQLTTIAMLKECRFIDLSHIELIDKRYNEKRANIDREIMEMRAHLEEMEAAG